MIRSALPVKIAFRNFLLPLKFDVLVENDLFVTCSFDCEFLRNAFARFCVLGVLPKECFALCGTVDLSCFVVTFVLSCADVAENDRNVGTCDDGVVIGFGSCV